MVLGHMDEFIMIIGNSDFRGSNLANILGQNGIKQSKIVEFRFLMSIYITCKKK